MQKYYTQEEYQYLESFSSISTEEIIYNQIDQSLISSTFFPGEILYFLSTNITLLSRDDYPSIMKNIFEKFQKENMFEETLYNFLDGWSDHFTKNEEYSEISIMKQKIKRTIVDDRIIEKIKDMLYEVLPMLGETKLLDFYKIQLQEDFSIWEY